MRRSLKHLSLAIILIVILFLASRFILNNKSDSSSPTILEVKNKTIEVNGKSKVVYTIEQPDGTWGYYGTKGKNFNVTVRNKTKVPTVIHWHGLILPNAMDGVHGITQAAIPPGGEHHYEYPLVQAGTYWMHSHMGLQIQDLMEAPFIIADPNDPYKDDQQVVILFQDFTFKNPETVFKDLHASDAMAGMDMSGDMQNMSGMSPDAASAPMIPMEMKETNVDSIGMRDVKLDLNDVQYDAFLTNYHTLKKPELVTVKADKTVRLRFINGSASSNFWINLGNLTGTAIAFDGENIKPITGSSFQLAIGQRIDVLVKIPAVGGAFPVLGQVEGLNQQTGLILVTPNATVPEISETASDTSLALNYQQELVMKSETPLPQKPIVQVITLDLSGDMQKYVWMINGQAWPNITPIKLKEGERVELIFNNQTGMAHPMHLHGHVFELVEINQKKITDGALHDTILVLPHTQVKVIFDTDYTGKWMLHCHMAYHQEAGMMTFVEISDEFTDKETNSKNQKNREMKLLSP